MTEHSIDESNQEQRSGRITKQLKEYPLAISPLQPQLPREEVEAKIAALEEMVKTLDRKLAQIMELLEVQKNCPYVATSSRPHSAKEEAEPSRGEG